MEDDVDLPDLSETTYETYDTLAQRLLPHQVDTGFDAHPESHGRQAHDCVHESL